VTGTRVPCCAPRVCKKVIRGLSFPTAKPREDRLTAALAFRCLRLAGRVAALGLVLISTATAAETPEIFFDKHGLIVQRGGDGGDTAQREGWAWFGAWIRANLLNNPWAVQRSVTFSQVMEMLEAGKSGLFRRHPDQYNATNDFSRDQTIPLAAAMGVYNDTERLNRMWKGIVDRGYKAQNDRDIISFEYVGLFARARGADPHIAGDIQLFGSVWTRIGVSLNNRDDVGDDLNLIMTLLMAKLRKSTTWSDRALTDYAKNRPVSYGCYLGSYRAKYGTDLTISPEEMRKRMDAGIAAGWKPDCPRVLGALRWYFRTESNGNPELAELYEPIVRKWMQ
jgi:hypothetical protein